MFPFSFVFLLLVCCVYMAVFWRICKTSWHETQAPPRHYCALNLTQMPTLSQKSSGKHISSGKASMSLHAGDNALRGLWCNRQRMSLDCNFFILFHFILVFPSFRPRHRLVSTFHEMRLSVKVEVTRTHARTHAH